MQLVELTTSCQSLLMITIRVIFWIAITIASWMATYFATNIGQSPICSPFTMMVLVWLSLVMYPIEALFYLGSINIYLLPTLVANIYTNMWCGIRGMRSRYCMNMERKECNQNSACIKCIKPIIYVALVYLNC